jgi:hypothetical protein
MCKKVAIELSTFIVCWCNSIEQREEKEEAPVPFAKLHTLCLSRTSVCEPEHLHALNEYPELESLRIMVCLRVVS